MAIGAGVAGRNLAHHVGDVAQDAEHVAQPLHHLSRHQSAHTEVAQAIAQIHAQIEQPVHDLWRNLGDGGDVVLPDLGIGRALVDGRKIIGQGRGVGDRSRGQRLDFIEVGGELARRRCRRHGTYPLEN